MATRTNFTKIAAVLAIVIISAISINNMQISGASTTNPCNTYSYENVNLGSNLNTAFDTELDRGDLCLFDGEVSLQGDSADTKEILMLGHKSRFIGPATALTSSDEYGDIVLEADAGSIKLFYIFDTSIDLTKATLDSPLKIRFLGKRYDISKVSETSFNAIVGDSTLLQLGDSAHVGNETIQLLRVSQTGSIIVGVDNQNIIISRGGTEKIGGIEVTNIDAFYDSSNILNNFAELVIGKKSLLSVRDGQAYYLDGNWSWTIGGLTSKTATSTSTSAEFFGPFIGIKNEFSYTSPDDTPPKAGQCISLPDNYLQICLQGLTEEKYTNLEIGVESADLSAAGGSNSETTTHFKSSGTRLRVGGQSTDEAWITSDNRLYYDRDGVKSATFDGTNVATINNLQFTKSGSTFTLVSALASDDIAFSFSGSDLGTLTWNGRNIKSADGKLITKYGVVVKEGGGLRLQVPRGQARAIVNITSSAA